MLVSPEHLQLSECSKSKSGLKLQVISEVSVSPKFYTGRARWVVPSRRENFFRDLLDASQSRTSVLPECLKSRSGLKL